MSRSKKFKNLPTIAKVGLALVSLQALLIIAIETYAFLKTPQSLLDLKYWSSGKSFLIYYIMYIFCMAFSLYLYTDAILKENTPQIFSFIVFHIFSLTWSVIQYFQNKASFSQLNETDSFNSLKYYFISVPIILGITLGFWIYISSKLYTIYGWELYKLIGANLHLREIYKEYVLFVQLLKLGLFAFAGFSVQYTILILKANDIEFYITIILVPISLFIFIVAFYALKRESRFLMWTFIVGMITFTGYFTFKLIRIYDPGQEAKYINQRLMLTFFAVISIILVVYTIFQAIICLTNFKQGLRKQLEQIDNEDDTFLQGPAYYINAAGERRMALEEY
ncbi:hypothetical protein BB558_003339 [Smittium angustum]|uniref:Uncharacterized protein n=1 Tax=Smittium angustum TaxID=133377 RepID=A0A2U1J6B5_SMIAN|nr:hypothetical protein BB558_003339 [Smittium angustum]